MINFIFDPSKDPVEQIADKHKGTRKHFELYPQILLFPESGVWKFFFMDPLSLKALSAGSDKEGKLIYRSIIYSWIGRSYIVMKKMQKRFVIMLFSLLICR